MESEQLREYEGKDLQMKRETGAIHRTGKGNDISKR
jgi:hypothetical protein